MWEMERIQVSMQACMWVLQEKGEVVIFEMCDQQVHYYHRYRAMKELYKDNVYTVITENLIHDGKTKPPEVKTAKGRPRTKRFQRQSKFVNHEDSTI